MARAHPDSPSHNSYSTAIFEEGVITNVDKKAWTCTVETRHSAKEVPDVTWGAPYHHFSGGEGIHFMPEVGAIVDLCWPSDNMPPFIMAFLPAANAEQSTDGTPIRSTTDGGSTTDVSFRSRRPDLNPGDIAITGRDGNFLYLRRGGVVQLGSTPLSQRVHIPVLNYIKDFCENYEMNSLGGTLSWVVQRQENDPSGDAPVTYTLQILEHAQDVKATVMVRSMPIPAPDATEKMAYEIVVAPQGIDPHDGSYVSEKYSLLITMDGKKTELIGGSRTTTVQSDDTLTVHGSRVVNVDGDETHNVQGLLKLLGGPKAVLDGTAVFIGGEDATEPGVLGQQLVNALASMVFTVSPGPAPGSLVAGPLTPLQIAALQVILSPKVRIK